VRFLWSIQVKLIAAFVGVAVVALALAAGAFVVIHRGEQEDQALNEVVAASPAIFGEFTIRSLRPDPDVPLDTFVENVAKAHNVRVLLLDPAGTVVQDSGGSLAGKQIDLPPPRTTETPEAGPAPGARRLAARSYVSWKPADGAAGDGLILVTSNLPTLRIPPVTRQGIARAPESYSLILAVPEENITRAWLGLLPGLGVAAALALPVAILLAIVVARYITRPLQQLTLASEQLAQGTFDIQVSTSRGDEVGQLARAFSAMAERVGGTQRQMRTLVADVSHDLKTPLTSILGFAGALRGGKASDDAEVRRMGAVIEEEAMRLSTRLSDLVYLSEIESGQATLDTDQIDFGKLVTAVASRVFALGLAPGVEPIVDCPMGLEVTADAAKLERAVENLLENARKFTPEGGLLRVGTSRVAVPGGAVTLEVANSAPGLAEADVPRLFERFYRHDRSRAAGTSGSGLGLPIARDLFRLHGGSLDAALAAGVITFTAHLPAA